MPIKQPPYKPAKTPKKLNAQLLATRNKRLQGQRRRVLGRHYAAKYRVR